MYVVVELLDHPTVDREDSGSIPSPPFRSFGAIRYPLCLCLLEDTLKRKVVGPNRCVGSRLSCQEYNYLKPEIYVNT